MNDPIHIVCLDAPAPPDYGGAIDMFYKIKALHEAGQKIILHYFNYRKTRNADALTPYCKAIYKYKRKGFFQSAPFTVPYIVRSRINNELIQRLNEDEFPVLLEGVHCAGIAPYLRLEKKVVVRMHNDEAAYYHHLAKTEPTLLKRSYFLLESRLLRVFQQNMNKTLSLACLSGWDMAALEKNYGFRDLTFVPCFLPWQKLAGAEGKGGYCLYHGNLSVSENEEAALWLIENVFSKIRARFIIAGHNISKKIKQKGSHYPHISFVNNPTSPELDHLVKEAHIHVLPSLNNTGVKLKLLNAVFNGRFCITNYYGVKGSRIEKGVIVHDEAAHWISSIKMLMQRPFTKQDREERSAILALYNNQKNAEKLSELLTRYR